MLIRLTLMSQMIMILSYRFRTGLKAGILEGTGSLKFLKLNLKTSFITRIPKPMLMVLVLLLVCDIGCSTSSQSIHPSDMIVSDGPSSEVVMSMGDDSNSDLKGKIITGVTDADSDHGITETIVTSEEILADLISFDRVYQDLDITKITDIVDPYDGSSRLYIATQQGVIYSFDQSDTYPEQIVFLDIQELVSNQYNEEGLLGIAFDPDFQTNREFYVYYIAQSPRRSVVARYVDGGYGLDADEDSSEILLEIPQPFGNHNGGQLLFGPDGFLYIGLGDGGGANDPNGNAQNLETLLGSILRIDVHKEESDYPYGIPETNPFVDISEYRSEIWAYGFRNPWRFAFDSESGKLWAADVGQELWEEINKVSPGANYGWNKIEGFECLLTDTSGCDIGTITPVWTYGREQGCSVIGGVVDTGNHVQGLKNMYIFGDHCTGTIWGLKDGIGSLFVAELGSIDGNITTFGSDELGQVYVGTRNGEIYRLNSIE